MGVSFPGESARYREAPNPLLDQEAELRRLTEAVAAARRRLPPGAASRPAPPPARRRLPPGAVVPQGYMRHLSAAEASLA